MAISSEVQIANLALDYLGAEPITALADSPIVERNFDVIRDSVLEDRDWTFSIKRVVLSSPDAVAPTFEYAYKFTIPSDCLRIIEVNYNEYDWIREGNYILTDQASCNVKYVKREEDVSKFPASFVNAFALRLASAVAIPYTNSSEYAGGLYQMYVATLTDASGNDGRQGKHKPVKRNVSLRSRGYYTGNVNGGTV